MEKRSVKIIFKVVLILKLVLTVKGLHYTLFEETDPNHILGNVGDDDNIADSPGVTDDVLRDMRYSLLSDSEHLDKFAIEDQSGTLHTTARIDRESICPFRVQCKIRLRVGATSGGFYKTIPVDVFIIDINDNAPTFQNDSMVLKISENTPINSTFQILSASDIDMGPNNSIQSYELIPNTGVFALDIHPKIGRHIGPKPSASFELLTARTEIIIIYM